MKSKIMNEKDQEDFELIEDMMENDLDLFITMICALFTEKHFITLKDKLQTEIEPKMNEKMYQILYINSLYSYLTNADGFRLMMSFDKKGDAFRYFAISKKVYDAVEEKFKDQVIERITLPIKI